MNPTPEQQSVIDHELESVDVYIPVVNNRAAIISFPDLDKVRGFTWYNHTNGYVCDGLSVCLHQVILGYPPKPGLETNHKDSDKYNCRRRNLEWVTKSENQIRRGLNKNNKSGLKGVYLQRDGRNRPWRALLTHQGKQVFCQFYETWEQAARAYDQAVIKYHGKGFLNFPQENPNHATNL